MSEKQAIWKFSGPFQFGNMTFVFHIESDEGFCEKNLSVTGHDAPAQKAMECKNFSEAVHNYFRKNRMDKIVRYFNFEQKFVAAQDCFVRAGFGTEVCENREVEEQAWLNDGNVWERELSDDVQCKPKPYLFRVCFEGNSAKVADYKIFSAESPVR